MALSLSPSTTRLGKERIMEGRILDLLQCNDDPVNFEFPADFDWDSLESRITQVKATLEKILGYQFSISIDQYATRFCTLAHIVAQGSRLAVVTTIDFSNFGSLFTVGNLGEVDSPFIETIISEVEKAEFFYIPIHDLNEPYTGLNEQFKGQTWWYRFFEYL